MSIGADGMGPVRRALNRALDHLPSAPTDAAVVALAERYADDIDQAEVVTAQGGRVLDELCGVVDESTYERLRALLTRIERTTVLGLLGPKLQSALVELGMTPRVRAEIARKGGVSNEPVGTSVLDQYRAKRQAP